MVYLNRRLRKYTVETEAKEYKATSHLRGGLYTGIRTKNINDRRLDTNTQTGDTQRTPGIRVNKMQEFP